jgi:hypothetical protein
MRSAIAKDLRTPKYRQRIVRDRKTYDRKIKHRRSLDSSVTDRA